MKFRVKWELEVFRLFSNETKCFLERQKNLRKYTCKLGNEYFLVIACYKAFPNIIGSNIKFGAKRPIQENIETYKIQFSSACSSI